MIYENKVGSKGQVTYRESMEKKSQHPFKPYSEVSTNQGEISVAIDKEINEYQEIIIQWKQVMHGE